MASSLPDVMFLLQNKFTGSHSYPIKNDLCTIQSYFIFILIQKNRSSDWYFCHSKKYYGMKANSILRLKYPIGYCIMTTN